MSASVPAAGRLCLVTTNFNYGDYLDDCMHSVVTSRGFERVDYIVMDGGSTDQSLDIVARYKPQLKHAQSARDAGMYHAIADGFARSDARGLFEVTPTVAATIERLRHLATVRGGASALL